MHYDSTSALPETPVALADPPPLPAPRALPIAHWSHTAALLAVLLLSTFFGHSRAAAIAVDETPRIPRYVTTILLEWLLLGSVIAGIYHRGVFFAQAFRSRATSVLQSVGLGLAAYFSGLLALGLVGGLLYNTPLFHKRNEAVILAMLPHRPVEFLFWFGLSLSAGVCEELIFRGYLLQQLEGWTGSGVAAVIVSGLLFGGVHLYEGLGAILPLAALGILYGFLVRRMKGDLRVVIVAHTLQDFLVALLVLLRPLAEKYQTMH